jgi:hypothetical protein
MTEKPKKKEPESMKKYAWTKMQGVQAAGEQADGQTGIHGGVDARARAGERRGAGVCLLRRWMVVRPVRTLD